MNLRQEFIQNLKEFRKKEGFSQMKLAELCNTSASYIGEIEIGRKFPSIELIENISKVLRIEPYHLFKKRENDDSEIKNAFPLLPNAMKKEIKEEINSIITTVFDRY